MATLNNHLQAQNTLKAYTLQQNNTNGLNQNQRNIKNINYQDKMTLKVCRDKALIFNNKNTSITQQKDKQKHCISKFLSQVKQKLLNLQQEFAKKQLNLKSYHQNLSAELKQKQELIHSMRQKIGQLSHQNMYLKQKKQEITRLLPQTIMEFFNKQNSNILLSERNIKKWFKILEQSLIEKIRVDLNEKYKDEQQQRLTFATSDNNTDQKSKNSLPSVEQINKLHPNSQWKSFFNSEVSQMIESKIIQQGNYREHQNVESSFVLTESKQSFIDRKNQLYFQKTIQFKFQGNNYTKKENKNKCMSSNNLCKIKQSQQSKINRQSYENKDVLKSNLNFICASKVKQNFGASALNQQDYQKRTAKKFAVYMGQNKRKNPKNVQIMMKNQKTLDQQNLHNQFVFKNELLRQYNRVLVDTHQNNKRRNISNIFQLINMQLTAKKLNFK